MKKINCNILGSTFLILSIIMFILTNILSVYLIINDITNNNSNAIIAYIIIQILTNTLLILCIIVFNRYGCIIIYDNINNVLIRKGFLFGYRSVLNVQEITKVEIATFPREEKYYILIDNIHTKYDGFSKKSFFKIPYSNEGKIFIEQFYNLNK